MLKLLRRDPFCGERPRYVRAVLYRYRFSGWRQLLKQHLWWERAPAGLYLPPVRLAGDKLAVAWPGDGRCYGDGSSDGDGNDANGP